MRAPVAHGVSVSVDAFRRALYNQVAYAFVMHHSLTRAATEDYLKLLSRFSICLTPHNAWAEFSVHLHIVLVDSCRSGFMAYTGAKVALDKCC